MPSSPHPAQVKARQRCALLVYLLLALACLGSLPASAGAAGFGELGRFGEPGAKAGKLMYPLEEGPEGIHSIGLAVDPTENAVFVLDEPKEAEEVAGQHIRTLRLQKFSETGKLLQHREFTQSVPSEDWNGAEEPFAGGIAVDPGHDVFVLAAASRKASLKFDQGSSVASTLYAFATATLAPAGKTLGSDVLTGPEEFEAESEAAGKALLEPAGVAADPAKHEAIVLGHVDTGGTAADDLSSAADHYALQRISATGALEARYLDSSNFLKPSEVTGAPDSPVVASGSPEHVYVNFEGVVEIPYEFTSATPPRFLTQDVAPPGTFPIAQGEEPAKVGSASPGGSMATSPDGGTLVRFAGIRNELLNGPPANYFGVLETATATGAQIGWSGGQAPALALQDKCVLTPGLEGFPVQVAAGKEGKVFVLATEFLDHEATGYEEPFFDGVIELGPSGTGCPEAKAGTPTVEADGKVVQEGEAVKPGTKVTLSAPLTQADALSSEWNFGDGSAPEKIETISYGAAKTQHTFTKGGPVTVKAIIHTNDLATPTLEVTKSVSVETAHPAAHFNISPSPAKVGEAVTFNASKSIDPESAPPLKYDWNFGDGSAPVTTANPVESHAYHTAGTYKITLRVTNNNGFSGEAVLPLSVNENPPPPPPGGGSTGGGATGGGSTQTTTPSSEVKGSTEVKPAVIPNATIAGVALNVSRAGATVVKVRCPAGESSCSGTITLRTLTAVRASRGRVAKSRAAILTLASASFTVAGGQTRAVTLHLSSKARKLLQHARVLRAAATVAAHDPAGATHTTHSVVTLRLARH